jgi:hypothetical protein
VIEVVERWPWFANRCIGPIEVLRHGSQYVLDSAVAAGVDLIAANDDQFRSRGLYSADVTSGHNDLIKTARVFAFGN